MPHIKIKNKVYQTVDISQALATIKEWDAMTASLRHDHITDQTEQWAAWDAAILMIEDFKGTV